VRVQHDILWDDLTAREHVTMFCELRCLPRADIPRIVQERLEDVQLWEVRSALGP
jgi:ABC-type multidrug transport system ATPase subunit